MNNFYLKAYRQKVQTATYHTVLPRHKLFVQFLVRNSLSQLRLEIVNLLYCILLKDTLKIMQKPMVAIQILSWIC